MTTAYPLVWPMGIQRTRSPMRAKFSTSMSQAVKNVMDELRRFGKDSEIEVEDVVISSNVTLTDQRPADAGVAVYFRWDKIDCCIALDRYVKPEDNLQAAYRIVEAERTKLRHGGLNIVRAGFRGFAALPPPKDSSAQIARPWRDVLGVDAKAGIGLVEQRYRELVKTHHPDAGGDAARFNQITDAVRQARLDLGDAKTGARA